MLTVSVNRPTNKIHDSNTFNALNALNATDAVSREVPNSYTHSTIIYYQEQIYLYTALTSPTQAALPLLDQEDMHRCVRDHDEGTGEDGEPDDIFPQREHVESERAQDRGSRYFDVQAVLVVD